MKFLLYLGFTLMIGNFLPADAKAQKPDKAKAKELVDSKQFVFQVQTVIPSGGSNVQVTSDYDMKLYGDSLVTYLPYFGRAYSSPGYGEGGGINITSTEFLYNSKAKKKGGWEITIKPSDTKDVRQMFLSLGETGYGSLQVISNNRQAISYYGYIKAK